MTTTRDMGTDELVARYLDAKSTVIDAGHASEIAWQAAAGQRPVTPRLFVREAAWVVLSAGMSEAVVRGVFPALQLALRRFSPAALSRDRAAARAEALASFGHEGKIDAILRIADTARRLGATGLEQKLCDPEPFLLSLPYIGPVTWRHLAKNLGVPVAKADRHLVRLAAATGRNDVDGMCAEISDWLGEPVAVVDVVLWRWAVLHAANCGRPCFGLPHSVGEDEGGASVASGRFVGWPGLPPCRPPPAASAVSSVV